MNTPTMRSEHTHTAKLSLSLHPGESRIEVDGRELEGVSDVRVHASAQGCPTLELGLVTYDIEINGETQTVIPDATRETLIALGWTPPND